MIAHPGLFLVGRSKDNDVRLARRCGWCRRFASVADMVAAHEDGAHVKPTICPSCAPT